MEQIVLKIDTNKKFKKIERHKLLGSNLALWHPDTQLENKNFIHYLKELKPAFLRMPGGSWSDEFIWNGNGIRTGEKIDTSKFIDSFWQVDFSDYAPGFHLNGVSHVPDLWHGYWGVLKQHTYIQKFNAGTIVTVNAGSGNAKLAAEWVRFANVTHKFGVKYWEIGNELEGSWEMGHFLPDGSKLTGKMYAKRFAEFAKAMKAVDPKIKIGGPVSSSFSNPFLQPLLKYAGEFVDFISFHTYPLEKNVKDPKVAFDKIRTLGKEISKIRELIAMYQSGRKIEIAITEWNSMVNEGRETADLFNGLWTCVWIGEMMRNEISFATQWDLLTSTSEGGHGMFFFDEEKCIPKSQYWAFYLWSKFMGNQFVDSRIEGAEHVYSVVTQNKEALQIMLVNASHEHAYRVKVETLSQAGNDDKKVQSNPADNFIGKSSLPCNTKITTLSLREYFWDYNTHRPLWSHPPMSRSIENLSSVSLPPLSVRVIHTSRVPPYDEKRVPIPDLEIFMAKCAPSDLPLEAWILARDAKSVEVSLEGSAQLDRTRVRTAEGAGRFYITPNGPGEVSVIATCENKTITKNCIFQTVKERDTILWNFENPLRKEGITSHFSFLRNDAIKPNQNVLEIVLKNIKTREGQDILIAFDQLPKTLPKKRIGGVVFDLKLSRKLNFKPGAKIRAILQSEGNHWIPLDSISLQTVGDNWKTYHHKFNDPDILRVMNKTYALRFLLDAKKGINGSIYLDNVGFILR